MNLIVCLDDRDGMSFFGRRQSMDAAVRRRAFALAGDKGLWMSPYSAKQFSEEDRKITADEGFLEKAPEDAWCFAETVDLTPVLDRVRRVAVFRWNRLYPSDRKFPTERFADRWTLEYREEFPGSSHPRITMEVYQL